nr:hypothetical protein BaRGS_035109 [Batillaria attramentaria]
MCARFGDLCAKPAMPLKVPSPHWELPLEDGYVSVVDYRASPYGQGALSSSRRGDDARCGVNGRAAGGATTEGQDASRFQPGDVEMRKQRRREQNRRAAQRCRARKKMREVTITQELQKEVMTMRYLESQLQLLTSEKHDLEMTLTQHGKAKLLSVLHGDPQETFTQRQNDADNFCWEKQ